MFEVLPLPDMSALPDGFGADAIVAMLLSALVLAVVSLYVIKKFGTD